MRGMLVESLDGGGGLAWEGSGVRKREIGRGWYMSENDIQSALWGQPAAMVPLPVYRWYSSRPGL